MRKTLSSDTLITLNYEYLCTDMSMMSEFKEFAVKGNAVDMAVGIVIGAAFGTVVSSFVADIIMPPVGMLLGGVNFTELSYVLAEATADAEAVAINYGNFFQTVLDFLIVAWAIFLAVKMMNKLKRGEHSADA
ncbi:MAG: large-conductance mechanosensitive channel protein MscL [Rhodothermales bacterium]|nr:large-conductance mechanosensitive channel protein MscL [Rhodothermales bacterium]MDG2017541.1 large-conductance mechanosensitive channel protein MscL [Rhodothermales bacterium]